MGGNLAMAVVYAILLWAVILFSFEMGKVEGRICALENMAGIARPTPTGDEG